METRKPNFGLPEPGAPPAPPVEAAPSGIPSAQRRLPEQGIPAGEPSAATARRRMSVQDQPRARRPPSEHEQARRRMLLLWTKWLLPVGALLLLGSIAAWPELNRSLSASRSAYHQVAAVNLDTGRMLGARYRGLDAHNRPYMITADEARQVGPDRIDLVRPIADTLTQSGTWVMIQARNGVYMPHSQILDLFNHVKLYRDDGTMMNGPTAVMDVKRGIVVTNDWVHAEGPFGVLDAQGDMMSQHDGIMQFRGPARMILNDDHRAQPANAAAASAPAPGQTPGNTAESRGTAR